MTRMMLATAVAMSFTAVAHAGEFNEKLKLGDPAPAWTNLPGVDGKSHALADLKDKQVVVLIFTCNSCPVAVGYEDRIIAFAKKFADKPVAIVAVNVNTIEADRFDKMKERAKDKGYRFPY